MSLIDVVTKSFQANLIVYQRQPSPVPVLIARPKINGKEVDCFVLANDQSGIVVVEYPLPEPVKESVYEEVMEFMDGVNTQAGLGHLFLEPSSGLPAFRDGLNTTYVSDLKRCISEFVKETGDHAFIYFAYLKAIIDGKSYAKMELKLLETSSSSIHMRGRWN